jgi:glycerol-3-phosphate dehydrogenase
MVDITTMTLRERNIESLAATELDVLVIGAGINGAVSANALAAHGVSVGLIDARDFAGFTSQHSSNLIWGGIKYLENFDIALVNELCQSRNELLDAFPSTVREIRFLTTLTRHFRYPRLLMFAGSWLYWLFGRGHTAIPRMVSRKRIKRLEPLVNVDDCSGGIEYSDAMLHDNDARFVFNFVRAATDEGCLAANYVRATGFSHQQGQWHVAAQDLVTNRELLIRSKVLVNATGAYADDINDLCAIETRHRHVFSKGIHLIVPRISRRDRVLAFFADDGRLFFAIPMANRTCIGTTDTAVDDPTSGVTDEDRQFVLDNINARLDLEKPLTTDDIISERCGVRPLVVKKQASTNADFLALSRKHKVEVSRPHNHISIFGGKTDRLC